MGGPVDTSGMDAMQEALNQMHQQLMQRNIEFKLATEPHKNTYQQSQKL